MEKISCIIPTFNEEVHIKEAISSVSFCDEIIVVDSFSTDRTPQIVQDLMLINSKIKFIQHEYLYSAAQKNWTIPQAQHEWIFLLDADERPTNPLIHEIQEILKKPLTETDPSAYWISRQNVFMDRLLKYTWKNDAVIRLFRKSKCRYEDKHVHAEILSDGAISKLSSFLTHDTYRGKGLISHLRKGERYTTWGALDRVDKIKKINAYHLFLKPVGTFLKHYILKGGFLDGKQGYIIASLSAWNVFIRCVKIWRMHHGEKFQ